MTGPFDSTPADGPRLATFLWGLRSLARLSFVQKVKLASMLLRETLSFPSTVLSFFVNSRIHPGYGLTWRKRLGLACHIYWNSFRVVSLVSYKASLMMAVKIFEIPPEVPGVVVECGCFLGGTSANLSLACAMAGRRLILYDSFEGLPVPVAGEALGRMEDVGQLRGELERVRANIARTGNLEVCTLRKGWFADTLPHHSEPIVLAFLDVDYEASLHDCVVNLWPHIVPNGYLFIDEYVFLDYCALFFSERYWQEYFGERPPGLMGAGTGVGMGQYYWGPFLDEPVFQHSRSIAYTWKGNSGYWRFYPPGSAGAGPDGERSTGTDPSAALLRELPAPEAAAKDPHP